MIPLVQIIFAVVSSIFGAKILGFLNLPKPDSIPEGRMYVLPDHPAAQSNGAMPVPNSPTAPGTPGTTPAAPPAKQIVADAIRQPWTIWGLAALGLTLPLVVSQFRAAAHEAGSAGRSVYNEGRSAYKRVDDADNYTQNKSRARRK
ncbi:hypothetical protein ACFFLM_21220 [Deinococcus oregonensis]|uniref:Uncharacterized protein n=1 Tax=Deinococcus oregonensis TaxID=1805970 RepID=A0ABV6B6J4_9DEIO